MLILVLNSGSSSLKFSMYELDGAIGARPGDRVETRLSVEKLLFKGELTAIGASADGKFKVTGESSELLSEKVRLADHKAAIAAMFDWVEKNYKSLVPVAVGHRIVHGGRDYVQPCLIDNRLLKRLEELSSFAPNHLPAALETVHAALECFPDAQHVGCFDTAFHRTMPEVARVLPLPIEFFEEGVEKFGFHGLSYEYVLQEFERVHGTEAANGRLVIAHLGNGCSLAAVKNRRCFDTTMGFSPTGGLVMGTRSGDLDPGLVDYLCDHRGLSTEEFAEVVNKKSGLIGLSGVTSDMQTLLAKESDNEGVRRALEIFCYHAAKHICAMASTIGGIDSLIFTGGIGEHADEIRRRICNRVAFLGARTFVIKTNEELIIARHAYGLAGSSDS